MKKIIFIVIFLMITGILPIKAEQYNLDRFLELVERNSQDLKLARQDVKIAGAQKKLAISGALPKISAGAGYMRNPTETYMYFDAGKLSGDSTAGISKIPISRNNEYSANVMLSQTLFSGAVYNAIQAARQYHKLTDFMYDASYQEIITYAKTAFYQTLLLKKVWEVSLASEHNARAIR